MSFQAQRLAESMVQLEAESQQLLAQIKKQCSCAKCGKPLEQIIVSYESHGPAGFACSPKCAQSK